MRRRLSYINEAIGKPIWKFLFGCWVILGGWDLFVDQLLPPEWESRFPDAYKFLSTVSGFLPWWGWAIAGLFLLPVLLVEYGVRQRPKIIFDKAVQEGNRVRDEQLLPVSDALTAKQAIMRIIDHFGWEHGSGDAEERAELEFRDKARLNKVRVWGRPLAQRVGGFLGTQYPKKPIDPEYWDKAQLDIVSIYSGEEKSRTYVPEHTEYSDVPIFDEVEISQEDALKVWPEKIGKAQIPLREAIAYLCEQSEWGATSIAEGSRGEFGAAKELRQAALDGQIQISGRHEMSRGSISEFYTVWVEIPREFWKTHEFDLAAVLDNSAHWQKAETQPENMNDPATATISNYAALRVEMATIEARWPRRSGGPG